MDISDPSAEVLFQLWDYDRFASDGEKEASGRTRLVGLTRYVFFLSAFRSFGFLLVLSSMWLRFSGSVYYFYSFSGW